MGTWIRERWPDATVESITWLPESLVGTFSEPGNGLDFRSEPMIQLFASRDEYGIRPGWSHSYPYGPRIEIPPDPFLVVTVTSPGKPSDMRPEITGFLERIGIPIEQQEAIFAHLDAQREKHTGIRDPATGSTTWKYGHWAPIPDLQSLDRLVADQQDERRFEFNFVGWTDVIFDPQWKITLDQPVRSLELESSIGTIKFEIDGSDLVHASSPKHFVGNETVFRHALHEALTGAELPFGRLGESEVNRATDC
jgi:hypothetical protein